ncbi:MAG: TIGR04283 family arsenosugar biosynthesis glycosyltransferase [Alcanivoracaceae bacterium]
MSVLWLSIVIPTLNEAAGIRPLLLLLQPWRRRGVEIILADGGSDDDTAVLAGPLVDRLVQCERGRSLQQNSGAAAASGKVLWFLHADTTFVEDPVAALERLVSEGGFDAWGRFDVAPDVVDIRLRLVAAMMNLRSRWSGIATGDQGIFASRLLFERVGGFPVQPLMEDVEISRRLKQFAAPVCLRQRLVINTRRWRQRGVWRTVGQMWSLRARYFFGADPIVLHREYYGGQ